MNKIHKGEGAITGLTTNPQGLLKYCLSSPLLASLAGETEQMLNITDHVSRKHHQHSASRNACQEKAVGQMKDVLSVNNPFIPPEKHDASEMKLANLVTKQIMPTAVQHDILDNELRGRKALETYVNERIKGEKNTWGKMPKLKYLTWKDGCKSIKLKASSEVVQMKATNSLFVRLLLIAKSSRELDLQEIMGTYEFADYNANLMTSDQSLLPTTAKSALIHELERLVSDTTYTDQFTDLQSSILIDGMTVVQELVVRKGDICCCKDLAEYFIRSVDSKAQGYNDLYILFDNYTTTNSMKDR